MTQMSGLMSISFINHKREFLLGLTIYGRKPSENALHKSRYSWLMGTPPMGTRYDAL